MKSSKQQNSWVGEKITTASDMAAYEKKLIEKDLKLSEIFMDAAALGMFHLLERRVLDHKEFKEVILLVGKGNNGGDAFALGSLFRKIGYDVHAFQISEKLSELSQKKAEAFDKEGGKRFILNDFEGIKIDKDDLVIDGLLGTGFEGKIEGDLLKLINKINSDSGFVFSIDIPSGVSGNSGRVESVAIKADMTAYLGALKVGHLFEDGINHVGALGYVDFGMNINDLESDLNFAKPGGYKKYLPQREKTSHKYSVGEALVIAGSDSMEGAGYLSTYAALRSGAGIVKHFTLGKESKVIPEVISSVYDEKKFEEELLRAKSLLIGPGIGRGKSAKQLVEKVSKLKDIPVVYDADALSLVEKPAIKSVLTPHRGELISLLGVKRDVSDQDLIEKAKKYVDKHDVIIIFKGVPTVVIAKDQTPLCLLSGNPGMATAGSGDVLAGILVSMLAQGVKSYDAAVISVIIHGKAGDLAAKKLSERSMIAGDIIDFLPKVL